MMKNKNPELAVLNMMPGQLCTFNVTYAPASSQVLIGYSLTGPGPTNTIYGIVDLTQPIKTLASITADSLGDASFSRSVPSGASGVTFYTQALCRSQTDDILTNSLVIQIP
jgi:hypothetical protein